MDKNTINHYKKIADDTILQGKNMLKSCSQSFEVFSPNNSANVYGYHLFDKSKRVSSSIFILNNIKNLKEELQTELLTLLKANPNILEYDVTHVKKIRDLQLNLLSMEYEIFNYPLSRFIAMVQQEGTMLDFIGAIEKLKHDQIYNDFSENTWCNDIDRHIIEALPEKIEGHIANLQYVFDEKYGHGSYLKIQKFRETFLKTHSFQSKTFRYNDVLPQELYQNFIQALEVAMKKDLFPGSSQIYNKAIKHTTLPPL